MNGYQRSSLTLSQLTRLFMILPSTITSNLTTVFNKSFFLYIQHLVFDYKTLSRTRIELAEDTVHWLDFPVTVVNC